MKRISQKTLEMVLNYGVYDTGKYRYRARYHTLFVEDNKCNYRAKIFVQIQRMPIRYIGTIAMIDADSWENIADIDVCGND